MTIDYLQGTALAIFRSVPFHSVPFHSVPYQLTRQPLIIVSYRPVHATEASAFRQSMFCLEMRSKRHGHDVRTIHPSQISFIVAGSSCSCHHVKIIHAAKLRDRTIPHRADYSYHSSWADDMRMCSPRHVRPTASSISIPRLPECHSSLLSVIAVTPSNIYLTV